MTELAYAQDIANRLRGVITIPVDDGMGLLDGKDTFTRDFGDQGDLQNRAALLIESLLKREPFNPNAVQSVIDELMQPADPLGIGKMYVVPIRLTAANLLHLYLSALQNTDT
jgi:hypothetical protein